MADHELINPKTFSQRDELLAEMAFESYADYLQSDLWAWIRSRLMQQDYSGECGICGSKLALSWHHRRYLLATLCGNDSSEHAFARLCNKCHKAIHRENGEWLSLDVVDRRLCWLSKNYETLGELAYNLMPSTAAPTELDLTEEDEFVS